ncbi:ferritin-like domain-containing protein, partial [Blyttiomyces helicus]
VLNYALTLEHLEATFYEQSLQRFSADDFQKAGFQPGVRKQLETVVKVHEETHVTALQSTIKSLFGDGKAVPPCQYNFDTTVKDVKGFVDIAAALEKTGVSAYDGALQFVMANAVKTAAGAIATVEGRHSAVLNVIQQGMANGAPGPFDTPLGFRPVITIASQFIKSC